MVIEQDPAEMTLTMNQPRSHFGEICAKNYGLSGKAGDNYTLHRPVHRTVGKTHGSESGVPRGLSSHLHMAASVMCNQEVPGILRQSPAAHTITDTQYLPLTLTAAGRQTTMSPTAHIHTAASRDGQAPTLPPTAHTAVDTVLWQSAYCWKCGCSNVQPQILGSQHHHQRHFVPGSPTDITPWTLHSHSLVDTKVRRKMQCILEMRIMPRAQFRLHKVVHCSLKETFRKYFVREIVVQHQ